LANHVSQAWFLTQLGMGAYPGPIMRSLLQPIISAGSLAMPLAYTAAIALLLQHALWGRVLRVFVPAGRMALTNYALQALLPALLFGTYSPGVSRMALGVWLTIATLFLIVVLQLMLSRIWMRSHLFGPLEWLWRTLTYWRLQPIRLRGVE